LELFDATNGFFETENLCERLAIMSGKKVYVLPDGRVRVREVPGAISVDVKEWGPGILSYSSSSDMATAPRIYQQNQSQTGEKYASASVADKKANQRIWNKYIITRTLFATGHFTILTYTICDQINNYPNAKFLIWFCYLTHWSLVVNCVHQAKGLIKVHNLRSKQASDKARLIAVFAEKYEPIRSIAFTLSTVVTVLYWSLDGGAPINLLSHGLPALLYLLETVGNNLSFRHKKLRNYVGSAAIGFAYLIFNVIYTCAGGTDETGNHYLYKALRWLDEPGVAVGYSIAGLVAIPVIHKVLGVGVNRINGFFYSTTRTSVLPKPSETTPLAAATDSESYDATFGGS
jgi:hypothetical protein